MCLITPSIKGLQRLLKITEQYCFEWDIMLNPQKSKNMEFGKMNCSIAVSEKVKCFYRSAIAILKIEGHSNELVML